jgi:transcription elongation factor Elf1
MSNLDYCPFCGADEVALETASHRHGSMAQVVCGHCCARGGNFVDIDTQKAKAQATKNWNQKGLRRRQKQRN